MEKPVIRPYTPVSDESELRPSPSTSQETPPHTDHPQAPKATSTL